MLVDVEFPLSCSTWHLARLLRSLVSYRVKHSKRNSTLTSAHVLFSIYYIDTDETRFPLLKIHIFIARSEDTIFIFPCEDIGFAMVTNMTSQLQESFPLRRAAGSFEISFTEKHSGRFDHFNCTILLFRKWIRKNLSFMWNFISIYKINRTLHGRLGIRKLSSSAASISNSKIKFVSPRGHVISSMYQ